MPAGPLASDLVHQPLEQANEEIKHYTDVVGVFTNPEALLRLAGAVLVGQHDKWAVTDRRYFSERYITNVTTLKTQAGGQVTTPRIYAQDPRNPAKFTELSK